jgi:hypothetical protein
MRAKMAINIVIAKALIVGFVIMVITSPDSFCINYLMYVFERLIQKGMWRGDKRILFFNPQ